MSQLVCVAMEHGVRIVTGTNWKNQCNPPGAQAAQVWPPARSSSCPGPSSTVDLSGSPCGRDSISRRRPSSPTLFQKFKNSKSLLTLSVIGTSLTKGERKTGQHGKVSVKPAGGMPCLPVAQAQTSGNPTTTTNALHFSAVVVVVITIILPLARPQVRDEL